MHYYISDGWWKRCCETAQERETVHRNHASSRPLSSGYELIGICGELAFSRKFNLPMDWSLRPSGDRGVDFVSINGDTIDVKTARKPYNLIAEIGKPLADILVLAGWNDEKRTVHLIGWELGEELYKAPYRDFGYGVVNHFIHASRLRPMEKLAGVLDRGRKITIQV